MVVHAEFLHFWDAKFSSTILVVYKVSFIYFLGVALSFSRSSYIVNENRGPSQPVLILSNPLLCCSISVMIKIEEGTAKGKV